MIRNIVFDMGQVLKRFDPDLCIRPYVTDPSDAAAIRRVCFDSPEWVKLDEGTLDYPQALEIWKSALPDRLHSKVDEIIENWHLAMTDIPETNEILRALWKAGYKIYLLSNVSVRFERIRPGFPALELMSGEVLSSAEKLLKPDPRIYRILLDRYGLIPSECLFIDDSQANTDGARAVGMRAVRYDQDPEKLISGLAAAGVKVQIT